jgi:hypothetical protein
MISAVPQGHHMFQLPEPLVNLQHTRLSAMHHARRLQAQSFLTTNRQSVRHEGAGWFPRTLAHQHFRSFEGNRDMLQAAGATAGRTKDFCSLCSRTGRAH